MVKEEFAQTRLGLRPRSPLPPSETPPEFCFNPKPPQILVEIEQVGTTMKSVFTDPNPASLLVPHHLSPLPTLIVSPPPRPPHD